MALRLFNMEHVMKRQFTLIELLSVMLIFGILATVGLSINKPSQVKDQVYILTSSIQRARAHAISKRNIAYVRVDEKLKS